MKSVVTGLMMLAGAMVRQKGHGLDDFGWRREIAQAREAEAAATQTAGSADGAALVVAGPPLGTAGPSSGALMSAASASDERADAPGDWDVACERGAGSRLVFDRGSVRELGGATLFRWAPVDGTAPHADDLIYTAVADCRAKSIEASWPGKRSETRAGTCGRLLVDSVCSARSAAKAPKPERGRAGRASSGGPSASATP